jgi:hypothetical protein
MHILLTRCLYIGTAPLLLRVICHTCLLDLKPNSNLTSFTNSVP